MSSDLVARPLGASPRGEDLFEPLDTHLERVAALAQDFAARFGAGGLGRLTGLLHDLGKAKPEWQRYIRGAGPRVPHAGEGARWIDDHSAEPLARLLAFAIAGHHAGLANGLAEGGGRLPLKQRLQEAEPLEPWLDAPVEALTAPPPALRSAKDPAFAEAFFTRMLFSCLVDADRLASESAEGGGEERGWRGEISALAQALDAHLNGFEAPQTPVDVVRAELLAACRAAAVREPGLFSLTAPTGSGKTLSSLAFALDHARRHNLERVVYVIPFTSIIEQTAGAFREALGDADAVLEHHSAFEPSPIKGARADEDAAQRHSAAVENWDRPVIVTTAVQFFESLFAASPARCRKLHRLARSVIVLDEAQTLPLKLLRPCLAALDALAHGYGASVVLCTATQPAVTKAAGLDAPEALKNVREITPDPARMAAALKRVTVIRAESQLDNATLATQMAAEPSALAIVNSRAHALDLFDVLRREGVLGARHLSTTMTPVHRQAVLDEIRRDLSAGAPTRLVSTSLIEAGVDISFAAVWRAAAGVDAIAQAAGRCNRNGELGPSAGRVTVFTPADHAPPRELAQFAQYAEPVLAAHADILAPEAVAAYFRALLWGRGEENLDALKIGDQRIAGVMAALHGTRARPKRKISATFPFADIAAAFRFIEDAMVPVIVPETASPYGAPSALIDQLRHAENLGGVARRLQRHIVGVPRKARGALLLHGRASAAREDAGEQFVLLEDASLYDADRGLDWRGASEIDAGALMIGL